MMNGYILEHLAQDHRQDLIREAAHQQLLDQLPPRRRNPLLLSRPLFHWSAFRLTAQKHFRRRLDG